MIACNPGVTQLRAVGALREEVGVVRILRDLTKATRQDRIADVVLNVEEFTSLTEA